MNKFKKGDVVLITTVDPYGFLGREAHPEQEHIGLTAEVVSSQEVDCGDGDDERELFEFVRVITYGDNPVNLEMVDFEIAHNTCGA